MSPRPARHVGNWITVSGSCDDYTHDHVRSEGSVCPHRALTLPSLRSRTRSQPAITQPVQIPALSGDRRQPIDDIPAGSVGEGLTESTIDVDVRYEYDALPGWLEDEPTSDDYLLGRATGVSDRGQRSAVTYDARGNANWTARQMAFISNRLEIPYDDSDPLPELTETAPSSGYVSYDEDHTYIERSDFDHAGRGRRLYLPRDPDYGSDTPQLYGQLALDRRGLPVWSNVIILDESSAFVDHIPVLGTVLHDEQGRETLRYTGDMSSTLTIAESFSYDVRGRPMWHLAYRFPSGSDPDQSLQDLQYLTFTFHNWDAANNLTYLFDNCPPGARPDGHRLRSYVLMAHDSLYRLTAAELYYMSPSYTHPPDVFEDWRDDADVANDNDPMQPRPAPIAGGHPTNRANRLDYEWDWLGNQVAWDDDASSFYERSLGTITNGRTEEGEARPSALYLATNIDNIPGIEGGWDGAGWVEVDYGDSGNVESFTVHGECTDTGTDTCTDNLSDSVEERADNFRDGCTCGVEQHYSYRWDELNRLVDARRYDRVAGDWVYQTRLRYRYDAANQRTVEESFAFDAQNTSHRVALTVYPGHFERRGLERGDGTYDFQTSGTGESATETQYMVSGARIVWDPEPDTMGGEFDRNRRATVRVSDLLGTSSAVLDIESRELLEMATYYPSGARENLWTDEAAAPLEPIGFTGKEADEEIGAVYFGERWLIPRLGRWATPDPLHIHASGGGEALNSYHYVSGNLLEATDPLGLSVHVGDIDLGIRVAAGLRAGVQRAWNRVLTPLRSEIASAREQLEAASAVDSDVDANMIRARLSQLENRLARLHEMRDAEYNSIRYNEATREVEVGEVAHGTRAQSWLYRRLHDVAKDPNFHLRVVLGDPPRDYSGYVRSTPRDQGGQRPENWCSDDGGSMTCSAIVTLDGASLDHVPGHEIYLHGWRVINGLSAGHQRGAHQGDSFAPTDPDPPVDREDHLLDRLTNPDSTDRRDPYSPGRDTSPHPGAPSDALDYDPLYGDEGGWGRDGS